MDDNSPASLVPEDDESSTPVSEGRGSPLTGIERTRADLADSLADQSDHQLIAKLHLSKPIVRVGQEFELQRRYVERLTIALAGGTKAAWALVIVTAILGAATIALVIATWRLASGG